jgi:nucleotide-binding universal stress UspA family protein
MRTALDLAREREGDVFVISVVVKSRSSPFALYTDDVIKSEFSDDRRELLERAIALAEPTDVTVDGRLVVANSVASGIITAVEECEADVVLMGWHARRHRDLVMGHTVDEVVTKAPCDVLVEKIGLTATQVDEILLPAGKGPDMELATTVARAIARANDARIDVVRVVTPKATETEREQEEQLLSAVAANLADLPTEQTIIEREEIVDTLIDAAEERDVTIIGGGRGGWFRRVVVGSTARQVGQHANATLIIATRHRGVQSWVSRLLR